MWKNEYATLEDALAFLVDKVEHTPGTGFSFCSIVCGNTFEEAFEFTGAPETYTTESDQQQTAEYIAFIDHPEHGKRDHHKLKLLLWAFNREPISILKLHFYYYSTGAEAEPFNSSVTAFLNRLVEKLGPPELKKMTRGKQQLSYKLGQSTLRVWNNTEGVRIEIR